MCVKGVIICCVLCCCWSKGFNGGVRVFYKEEEWVYVRNGRIKGEIKVLFGSCDIEMCFMWV